MERLCLMLGSALVLAAVCLYVYDRLEDARAGVSCFGGEPAAPEPEHRGSVGDRTARRQCGKSAHGRCRVRARIGFGNPGVKHRAGVLWGC